MAIAGGHGPEELRAASRRTLHRTDDHPDPTLVPFVDLQAAPTQATRRIQGQATDPIHPPYVSACVASVRNPRSHHRSGT